MQVVDVWRGGSRGWLGNRLINFFAFFNPRKLCGHRTVGVPRALNSPMCMPRAMYERLCSWISKIYPFGWRWRPLTSAGFNYISFPRPSFLYPRGKKNPVLFRITVGEKCFRVLRRVSWFDLADVPSFPSLFLSVPSCTNVGERERKGEEKKIGTVLQKRFIKSIAMELHFMNPSIERDSLCYNRSV